MDNLNNNIQQLVKRLEFFEDAAKKQVEKLKEVKPAQVSTPQSLEITPEIMQLEPGARVVEIAKIFAANPQVKGKYCWDWCEQVYNAANCRRGNDQYFDVRYEGRDCGSVRASPAILKTIRPGDWLFINNRNTSDTHGNHSIIILSVSGDNAVAASCPGANMQGRIHNANFINTPVTMRAHPVNK
jgi:hypothetical protein